MRSNLSNFLVDYHCTEDMNLFTYHQRGHGFIAVDYSFVHGLHRMRFHDRSTRMIEVGQKLEITDKNDRSVHFAVLLTLERKVVVQCVKRSSSCRCDPRVQKLSPIEFREKSRGLTWDDGVKTIPLAGHQEFRLRKDGGHVASAAISYVAFKNAWQIENKSEKTKRVQRLERAKRKKMEEEQEQEQPPHKK